MHKSPLSHHEELAPSIFHCFSIVNITSACAIPSLYVIIERVHLVRTNKLISIVYETNQSIKARSDKIIFSLPLFF